jgi:hypothetical protein
MLEKFGQLAEQAATNVSRRQFLGRFGRGAMFVAAAAGGMLAIPGLARGGRRPPRVCDNFSEGECNGSIEGDPCGFEGRCTIRGKGNTCLCVSRRRP